MALRASAVVGCGSLMALLIALLLSGCVTIAIPPAGPALPPAHHRPPPAGEQVRALGQLAELFADGARALSASEIPYCRGRNRRSRWCVELSDKAAELEAMAEEARAQCRIAAAGLGEADCGSSKERRRVMVITPIVE